MKWSKSVVGAETITAKNVLQLEEYSFVHIYGERALAMIQQKHVEPQTPVQILCNYKSFDLITFAKQVAENITKALINDCACYIGIRSKLLKWQIQIEHDTFVNKRSGNVLRFIPIISIIVLQFVHGRDFGDCLELLKEPIDQIGINFIRYEPQYILYNPYELRNIWQLYLNQHVPNKLGKLISHHLGSHFIKTKLIMQEKCFGRSFSCNDVLERS